MSPQQFIAKWRKAKLAERSACQQHFLDLCEMLEQPKPAEADPTGAWYTFERGVRKTTGGDGWADVWMRGHFGWEYKGKKGDLAAAYQQLNLYREDLENPPLLVVCDLNRFEIHTNFTGTVKKVYAFDLDGLSEAQNLAVLRKVFTDPQSLRPEQTSIGVTEVAAGQFGQLADELRARKIPAPDAAHFLMKVMFCLFAEKVGLLPNDLFTNTLKTGKSDPKRLASRLKELFKAMMKGGDFGADPIPYFNGGLFADSDVIELRTLEIERILDVSRFDWSSVEPSVFGTLFERSLDPDKRAQVGAQYTSKADILTLVEPVLMRPLRREWARVREECDKHWAKIQEGSTRTKTASGRRGTASPARKKHDKLIQDFVERLAHVQILDPACGSGNFLYVAIQLLLDLEKQVIAFAADRNLALIPQVRPTQLHGIEILTYAHQLAQVVIWIGYLQWMRENGFATPRDPILEPIESIKRMDAVLDLSDPDHPREPDWPPVDVIIGNPPFLGGNRVRRLFGDEYIDALFTTYADRVSPLADYCCYWFEKSRATIGCGRTKRVGLLATQGIRGGANREVLKRIKETGDIFFSVSDRDWVLDGANVHVSMVGFDNGAEGTRVLDGAEVPAISADLTSGVDLTFAKRIPTMLGIQMEGVKKGAQFDLDPVEAAEMLKKPNPNGRPNSDVVHRYYNGEQLYQGRTPGWLITFDPNSELKDAALYEAPFEYVKLHVYPKYSSRRKRWWIHERPRPEMFDALSKLNRYIATVRHSKYRLFAWLDASVICDSAIVVFARDDDYFFGVLHSAIHERWSRRTGTQLREAESGCRYTPTTCFEKFPFPPLSGGIAKEVPGKKSPAIKARKRIADAAVKLCELRENWLNPKFTNGGPMLTESQLKKRTLTNLYNERPTWLELAHMELDRAVLAAYGWPEDWADALQPKRDARGKVNPILGVQDTAVEQEVLARLLALNLELAR